MDRINTEGIERIGELNIRNYRRADVQPGAEVAFAAGRVRELEETALWVTQQLAAAGPYEDTRALSTLQTWIADRIRATQSKETESAES
jgi:hypothetical protein